SLSTSVVGAPPSPSPTCWPARSRHSAGMGAHVLDAKRRRQEPPALQVLGAVEHEKGPLPHHWGVLGMSFSGSEPVWRFPEDPPDQLGVEDHHQPRVLDGAERHHIAIPATTRFREAERRELEGGSAAGAA